MRLWVSTMVALMSWIDEVTVGGTTMVDVAVPAAGPMVTGTSVLVMVVQLVWTALG